MRGRWFLVFAGMVAACDRPENPVGAAGADGARPTLSVLAQQPTPDPLSVAAAVPGFGGYFIDESGAPTVYLKDPAQRPAAEAALAGFLSSFGWTAADLRVRQGRYDWAELDAWHRAASPAVLGLAGAVLTDIDESSNRLRFAGVDLATLDRIAAVVHGRGVPAEAVRLQLSGPVRQVATLRDKVRPVQGGLQIQFFALPASPLVSVCTIGFPAVRDGVNSFITNSHCTNVQGGTTIGTDYYQSTRGGVIPNPDNFIGFEVHDPDYATGGECPVGRTCRYSDAARVQLGSGQSFTLGRIARAAAPNPGTVNGDDDPSVLQVDSASPTWRIAGEQALPVLGQRLSKTGRTTGWTSGEVTATCVNINVTGSQVTQLCQSLVGAFVAGGDSGSPVFGQYTDGTVFLAGILWGSSTDLTTGAVEFIFSPLDSVLRELGALSTFTPEEPTRGRGKQKKPR